MEYWLLTRKTKPWIGGDTESIKNIGIFCDVIAAFGYAIAEIQKNLGQPYSPSQAERKIRAYQQENIAPNAGDKPLDALDPEDLLPTDFLTDSRVASRLTYVVELLPRLEHF